MANVIPTTPPSVEEQVAEISKVEGARLEPTHTEADSWKYDPNYHRMADFLGVSHDDKLDSDMAQKIAFLRDFTKATDEVDAKISLKEMQKKLGVSSKGKELVNHLYKYARLYQDREKIDKEISLLSELKVTENNNVRKS